MPSFDSWSSSTGATDLTMTDLVSAASHFGVVTSVATASQSAAEWWSAAGAPIVIDMPGTPSITVPPYISPAWEPLVYPVMVRKCIRPFASDIVLKRGFVP